MTLFLKSKRTKSTSQIGAQSTSALSSHNSGQEPSIACYNKISITWWTWYVLPVMLVSSDHCSICSGSSAMAFRSPPKITKKWDFNGDTKLSIDIRMPLGTSATQKIHERRTREGERGVSALLDNQARLRNFVGKRNGGVLWELGQSQLGTTWRHLRIVVNH